MRSPVGAASGCIALLLLGAGCQNAAERSDLPVPALLTETSPRITAELASAATQLLSGQSVALGRSAFTTNSELTLEPAMRNTPLGRLGTGRIVTEPDALRLLRSGRECLLEHINTGARITLKLGACTPAGKPE